MKAIKFRQLGLDHHLIRILDEIGFTDCTPVQAACLPLILEERDVAGQAQTGTGKTAAFLLSTIHFLITKKIENSKNLRAIVIAPTRELAIQIHKDAQTLNRYCDLEIGLVYGGVDYEKQQKKLMKGVDILIGTPGRLIDYFKQGVFNFRYIEVVVLDEADRMFDLGFISDIRYILRRMPKPEKRLNMLFSATLSYRVMELAYEHMNDPALIKINPEKITADNVNQTIYHVANEEKIRLLISLLKSIKTTRTIVFVNTKKTAEKVWSYLEGNKIHAAVLSGDVPQKIRQHLFNEFSTGDLKVLVATDLAARGLHISDVSHVFNYDLPQNAEDYVHRIGRTARAGASGDAVSFACEDYVYSLMEIESFIGYQIPIRTITEGALQKILPPTKRKHHKRSTYLSKNKKSLKNRNKSPQNNLR